MGKGLDMAKSSVRRAPRRGNTDGMRNDRRADPDGRRPEARGGDGHGYHLVPRQRPGHRRRQPQGRQVSFHFFLFRQPERPPNDFFGPFAFLGSRIIVCVLCVSMCLFMYDLL